MRATAPGRHFQSWWSPSEECSYQTRLNATTFLSSFVPFSPVFANPRFSCNSPSTRQKSDPPTPLLASPHPYARPFSPPRLAVHSEGAGWEDGTAACTTRSRELPPLQPRVPQSNRGAHRRGEHQEAQGGEEKAQRWEWGQAQRRFGGGEVTAPPVWGGSQRLGVEAAGGPGPLLQKSKSGLRLKWQLENVTIHFRFQPMTSP